MKDSAHSRFILMQNNSDYWWSDGKLYFRKSYSPPSTAPPLLVLPRFEQPLYPIVALFAALILISIATAYRLWLAAHRKHRDNMRI